jgi:hypothetical protein
LGAAAARGQLARDWPGKNPVGSGRAQFPCAPPVDLQDGISAKVAAPAPIIAFVTLFNSVFATPRLAADVARPPIGRSGIGETGGLLLTTNEDANVTVLDIGRHARTPGQICRPLIPIAPVPAPMMAALGEEQKARRLAATVALLWIIPTD